MCSSKETITKGVKVRISKGDTVHVKHTDSRGQTSKMAKVLEVTRQGCHVRIGDISGKEQMIFWPKLGRYPNGPWGKTAFSKEVSKKKTSKETSKKILPVVCARTSSLVDEYTEKISHSRATKLACRVVEKNITLDEENGAYVHFTPKLSKRWLDASEGKNRRKLSWKEVELTQSEMEAGNWSPRTGTPVQVDKDGFAVNGQTRLTAAMYAGLTIKLYVIFGVTKKEEATATDIGKVRSHAVCLNLKSSQTSTVNAIRKHSTGNRLLGKVTPSTTGELYDYYKGFIVWFDDIPGNPEGRKLTKAGDIIAVIVRALSCGEDEKLLTAFVQYLRRNDITADIKLSKNQCSMVNKLALYLSKVKASGAEARDARTSRIEFVLKKFLTDDPLTYLRANRENIWPCPLVKGY